MSNGDTSAGLQIGYPLLKALGVLVQGRFPAPTQISELESGETDKPPHGQDAGVALFDDDGVYSIVGYYDVRLRRRADTHTAHVTVTTLGDNTTTYRVEINGQNHDFTPGVSHTEQEALEGLRDEINTAGTQEGQASVDTTDPSSPVLVVLHYDDANSELEEDNYTSFTVSVTAGPGALSASVDATSVDFELWALLRGDSEIVWDKPPNQSAFSGVTENIGDRIEVSGYREMYIRITSTDGHVISRFAPATIET